MIVALAFKIAFIPGHAGARPFCAAGAVFVKEISVDAAPAKTVCKFNGAGEIVAVGLPAGVPAVNIVFAADTGIFIDIAVNLAPALLAVVKIYAGDGVGVFFKECVGFFRCGCTVCGRDLQRNFCIDRKAFANGDGCIAAVCLNSAVANLIGTGGSVGKSKIYLECICAKRKFSVLRIYRIFRLCNRIVYNSNTCASNLSFDLPA